MRQESIDALTRARHLTFNLGADWPSGEWVAKLTFG